MSVAGFGLRMIVMVLSLSHSILKQPCGARRLAGISQYILSLEPSMNRLALLIIVMTLMTSLGCASMQEMLAGMDKPTASIKAARLDGLSLQQAGLVFDVQVSNPYGVPLPLSKIDYALSSDGASIASGKTDLTGTIPAGQSKVISLPVSLVFVDLMQSTSSVRPGQVIPYQADLKLSVDAPGLGELSLPLSQKGEVPVPAVPSVNVTSVKFDTLTLNSAAAVVKMDITNTNAFPINLQKLGYALSLGGSSIGSSEVTQPLKLDSGQKGTLEIPIRFNPMNLGPAALNMLRGNGANFEVAGDMQVGTKFGDLNLPYRQSGKTALER